MPDEIIMTKAWCSQFFFFYLSAFQNFAFFQNISYTLDENSYW